MSAPPWRQPTAALHALGKALGLDAEIWPQRETPVMLTYDSSEIARSAAVALRLSLLLELVNAYGTSLTCKFMLDDVELLAVSPTVSADDLEHLRAETEGSFSVQLDLRIDKARLFEHWFGPTPSYCTPVLYLYPASLIAFLGSNLERIESQLWPDSPSSKTLVLVPSHTIALDGVYLAVWGGDALTTWSSLLPKQPPDPERPAYLYEACTSLVRWQGCLLRHLTPLHLDVHGQATSDDAIAAALLGHLAALCIIFTANRTEDQPNGTRLAVYHGARKSAQVLLPAPGVNSAVAETSADARSLSRLVNWTYDPSWSATRSSDRLSLVQSSVVGALGLNDPGAAFALLLRTGEGLVAEVQWLWQGFVEERVESYLGQVQELEIFVDATAQAFRDQLGALVKSVSDTMLAAIAALLGSFIAELVGAGDHGSIFTFGMWVYAGYVFAFPLIYNMANQWWSYWTLLADFNQRINRFEQRLSPERVEQVVGNRIAASEQRYIVTFIITVIIYIVIIGLAIVAASLLPNRLLPSQPPMRFL